MGIKSPVGHLKATQPLPPAILSTPYLSSTISVSMVLLGKGAFTEQFEEGRLVCPSFYYS
jgi:hypothetical protein